MIQRIQTVYLLLVVVLCAVLMASPIGRFVHESKVVATFTNFCMQAEEADNIAGPWPFGVLLGFVLLLTLASIFLFRHRMRQLRLVIFSTILLIGYVLAYTFMAWFYGEQLAQSGMDSRFEPTFAVVWPIICIILNCMAIRGIRKDEALIRSLDRLR